MESLEAPDGVEREGFFFFLPFSLSFVEQASLDALDKVLGLLFGSSVPRLLAAGSKGASPTDSGCGCGARLMREKASRPRLP